MCLTVANDTCITVGCSELEILELESSAAAAEADPHYFDKVQQDVENIVRKEIIQDEYRKVRTMLFMHCVSLHVYIIIIISIFIEHILLKSRSMRCTIKMCIQLTKNIPVILF